jgi:hypothetical protein
VYLSRGMVEKRNDGCAQHNLVEFTTNSLRFMGSAPEELINN